MTEYRNSGKIDCEAESVITEHLKGKTAIVTGGASGIGKEYSRALSRAGVHVVIADLNEKLGKEVQQELGDISTFVRCDVTSWEDQLVVFKKAKQVSTTSEIDIVVANAGVAGNDRVFTQEIEKDEPEKPDILTTNVDAIGVMWTTKLAMFYFEKQNSSSRKDRILVLQSSVAGYLDMVGAPQYNASKFFVRGLLRAFRQSSIAHGIRVNLIAPWFIHTAIIPEAMDPLIQGSGNVYASTEDAASALLKLVSDENIHGKRVRSHSSSNTDISICRALAIVPRSWPGASKGYLDVDQDDFDETSLWGEGQKLVLKPFKEARSRV